MKKSINMILAGILAVPVLAFGVNTMLSATVSAQAASTPSCPAGMTMTSGAKCAQGTGQNDNLFGTGGVFSLITNTALFIIGAVSVLVLIYGGILYTISGGDGTKVTTAKNTILYAVVGIIVAVLAYAIVNFVIAGLAGTSQ
jgi:hypothetical protein